MNIRQIGALAFAVLAIIFLMQGLFEVEMITYALAYQMGLPGFEGRTSAASAALALLIRVILAVALFRGRFVLVDRICGPGDDLPRPNLADGTVQLLAFSILGAYFTVHGTVALVREYGRLGPAVAWPFAIEPLLGLGLFFGSRGIRRVWLGTRGLNESAG